MASLRRSPEPRRRGLRVLGWVLAVAVLAGLVVLGLAKIDIAKVGRALAHVRAGWVAVAAGLMIATFLARGESWFAAIRAALPTRPISRSAVTRVLLIGMFGSSVAPGRLGEAARAWLITRHVGKARATLATVIGTLLSQTFLNLLALLILAAVALAGGAIPGAHAQAIAPVVALPVGIVIILALGPRLVSRAETLRWRALGRALAWLSRQLGDVGRGLTVFRKPVAAVHSTGFQLFAWALQAGACYSMLLAFGLQHRAGIATAAAILFAVNVTAVLPLTPSNVGVFQAACIAVLAPRGIKAETGLAYGLVLQAIEIISATVLGLPSLLREGLRPRDLRRQTGVEAAASGPADAIAPSGGDLPRPRRIARR